jgi:hypothetical protein
MTAILQLVEPVGITRGEMINAVMNADFTDIEDSFQYEYARRNRCGILITINVDDYKNADQSSIEILTPTAFVGKYMDVEP